ncbi:hypothetical protein AB4520_14425 [Vibrio renipiscarius]|uniref:hypothetical protein n=1 Tax=Vibrio renipiscarius TaxID=1461322 RepID=UPI0035506C6B
MALITEMTAQDARDFFLKDISYCNFPLPIDFNFEPLLEAVSDALDRKQNSINDIGYRKACDYEGANYNITDKQRRSLFMATIRVDSSSYLRPLGSQDY